MLFSLSAFFSAATVSSVLFDFETSEPDVFVSFLESLGGTSDFGTFGTSGFEATFGSSRARISEGEVP